MHKEWDGTQRRHFLTRDQENNLSDIDVLRMLQETLNRNFIQAIVGWETLYEAAEEAIIVVSQDLLYLQERSIMQWIDQAVAVARSRVITTIKAQMDIAKLEPVVQQWNSRNPNNVARKLCSNTSKLLCNLQKARGSAGSGPALVTLPGPNLTTSTASSKAHRFGIWNIW